VRYAQEADFRESVDLKGMIMRIRRFERYPAWAAVILGLCVFFARYASPRPSFDVHRNLFFTGLVIVIAALAAVIANEGEAAWNYWSGINVAAGVWLVASAVLIPAVGLVSTTETILGALLAILALGTLAIEIQFQLTRSQP
jgi:hypothetical protein